MAVASLNTPLPIQGLAAGGNFFAGLGSDPKTAMQQLGPMYQNAHNAALAMSQAQYQGVQTGYDQLRSDTDQIYNNIYSNMESRYGDVLGRIANTNTSNINDIGRNAEALSGQASQQMVSRGLGNTTVQQNMQRAIEADRARETTRSNEAFAQLGAGYADRIWSDRTAAQQNKAQMMAGLGSQQLGALERVNVGYPDMAAYASMAQMYGAQAEAERNRKQLGGNGFMQGGGASAGYTSAPSPWGSRSLGGGGGSYGGGGGYGYMGGGGGYYAPASPQQIAAGQNFYNAATGSNINFGGQSGGYSDLGLDYYQPDYGGVEGMDEVPMDYYGGDAYA